MNIAVLIKKDIHANVCTKGNDCLERSGTNQSAQKIMEKENLKVLKRKYIFKILAIVKQYITMINASFNPSRKDVELFPWKLENCICRTHSCT